MRRKWVGAIVSTTGRWFKEMRAEIERQVVDGKEIALDTFKQIATRCIWSQPFSVSRDCGVLMFARSWQVAVNQPTTSSTHTIVSIVASLID